MEDSEGFGFDDDDLRLWPDEVGALADLPLDAFGFEDDEEALDRFLFLTVSMIFFFRG